VLHSELPVGLIAAEIYFMSVTLDEIVIEDYQVHMNSYFINPLKPEINLNMWLRSNGLMFHVILM